MLGHLGLDLTAVAASAGFLGIVLGLAMQDTLGNVFAGLSLQMERPFSVDDWVRFGNQEGKVKEINWRSVTMERARRETAAATEADRSTLMERILSFLRS